jgi:hypothetical protein
VAGEQEGLTELRITNCELRIFRSRHSSATATLQLSESRLALPKLTVRGSATLRADNSQFAIHNPQLDIREGGDE